MPEEIKHITSPPPPGNSPRDAPGAADIPTKDCKPEEEDAETRKAKFGNSLRKKELTYPKDGSPYGDIPYRWEDKFKPF